ncbi:hypothetical protein K2X05_01570 [bacterium]|nr:hypothetical protein [bacterium]
MKKIIFFITLSIFVSSCEESLTENNSAPPEMVGAWSSSELVKASTRKLSKACENLDVSTDGVTMGLLKVESNGRVSSVREATNPNQPYRIDGRINAFGELTLYTEALEHYAGDAVKYAKEQGMSITSKVNLRVNKDIIKGAVLEMTIDISYTKNSLKYDQKLPTRYFFQTSEMGEKALLSKLQKCLED